MAAVIAVALSMAAATGTVPAAAKPMRIVSMNLCTDQLLMLLVERSRILSVSYLAADPRASAMADLAAQMRLNHGLAEEIVPLNPDLVLAGAFTTRPTVFLLRKLGTPVVELPVAASLDDIRSNIRILAKAVGEPARGAALIAAFDGRLPPPRPQRAAPRPLAALYWAGGMTSGTGTLANAVVEAAGFRTLGRALGLSGTGQLPLETLIAAEVDVLILGHERAAPALANELFRHPALRHAFATRAKVRIPDRLWVCGTPLVAEAIAQLSALRADIEQEAAPGATGATRETRATRATAK